MEYVMLDGMGAFFRELDVKGRRVNWSKIPFDRLVCEGVERVALWERIGVNLRVICREARSLGYTVMSLDDVAHLGVHEWHEEEVAGRVAVFREEFAKLFRVIREEGLRVFLTSDVMPVTPRIEEKMGKRGDWLGYYCGLLQGVFEVFPEVDGVVLRIGESDGVDVADVLRTKLHLRTAGEVNAFLRALLPMFEELGKVLVFRTWTVGAYGIGDLMWHRERLAEVLEGIGSENLVVSMKPGESDFFRYLRMNRAFFWLKQKLMIELQARCEYEGAGEWPSFLGWEFEEMSRELGGVERLVGISVWCQTGGWHRFGRIAFLEEGGRDVWIRLNCAVAVGIFCEGLSVEQVLAREKWGVGMVEFLRHAEVVVRELFYVSGYARQQMFFRRVRIPPLLHVYWDVLFVNEGIRAMFQYFVRDGAAAIRQGDGAFARFPRMMELAGDMGVGVEDVEHWRDFCEILLLARRYYFVEEGEREKYLVGVEEAKVLYKARWEKSRRYRIKVSGQKVKFGRGMLRWLVRIFLRRRRGYRLLDYVFTLRVLSLLYRLIRVGESRWVPKFLRKSAMGVDAVFR